MRAALHSAYLGVSPWRSSIRPDGGDAWGTGEHRWTRDVGKIPRDGSAFTKPGPARTTCALLIYRFAPWHSCNPYTRLAALHESVHVTGFGCRPMAKLTTRTEGRCPKAAREGKRGKWGTRLSGRYGDLGGRCGAASTG